MRENKRHIELRVVKVNGDYVTFQIADQTHRGKTFSQDGAFFKAKNGLWLASADKESFKCENVIFVRSDNKKFDDANIACTVYDFANVMEAVAEYNETDGRGYEKPWPQYRDKYFCIQSTGHVTSTDYDNHPIDNDRREFGNFFRTREKAEAALERVKKALKGPEND